LPLRVAHGSCLPEPFAGNFYADPTLLLPGVAGKKNLERMYAATSAAIR
jgi:hypothetical protein